MTRVTVDNHGGVAAGVALSMVIAFAAALAGQDPGHDHEKPFYSTRQQEADGSWSPARGGGTEHARLRVTSLMLLAKLGRGIELEPGRFRP